MTELIVKSFDIWTDAQGVKSKNRGKSVDNISLEGITSLRGLILDLAIKGKLVAQNSSDESASILLDKIAVEKTQLIKAGKIKKINSLPKIDKSKVPYKIPDNWAWSRLGNVCTKLTDGSHNPPRDIGQGLPMLSSQNIMNGKIDFENPSRYVSAMEFEIEDKRTQISPKDVLLTIVGTIGRSAVVPENAPKFVLQRSVAVLQSKLNPHFLAMQLVSPHCILYFNTHGKGTAQKGIYLGKLGLMEIVIPPLEEQNRIVAKVNELMALCDKFEEEQFKNLKTHQVLVKTLLDTLTQASDVNEFQAVLDRMLRYFDILFCTEDSIDQLKQTILQLAVMGKLVKQNTDDESATELLKKIQKEKEELENEGKLKKQKLLPKIGEDKKPFNIPSSWIWVPWGSILAYDNYPFKRGPFGSSLKKDMFIDSGYKVYEQYCPINDDCSFERYYISDELYEKLEGFAVKENDYLISCSGATLGRITQVPSNFKEGIINQALLRVRINHKYVDKNFFKLLFRSPYFQKMIFDNSTGSAIPNVKGVNELKIMPVPFLSLDEQQKIVREVEKIYSICDALKENIIKSQNIKRLLSNVIV
ncbi:MULTISPECIES: restriction endonuclease subunit S [Flavobacterium]|uniref:restriction endonuclease subunit S n=1 Tax=Flavobacterium TaxID=237 RepID=UPI001182F6A1|nr:MULTISPECIES: restriction endonuclease subunit S [Flavobacterium]MCR4029819.1 restriction endonuclease subunit S [Flavobacterium panacis]